MNDSTARPWEAPLFPGVRVHFSRLAAVIAATALSLLSPVRAEENTHYDEPGLSTGREYLNQHFAENIDPFTGNLSLQYVDLSIPGNAGFDIKVRRSYNSNWLKESTSAFGRGWDIHFGRVTHPGGQLCTTAAPQSMSLVLPDGSRETLHRSNGVAGTSTTDFVTTTFWKAQCDANGVIVFSPDGTRYDMTEAGVTEWHASRITDRFGNTMTLTYGAVSQSGRKLVTQVTANDGRSVTFNYASGRLTSITGGGFTWNYSINVLADSSSQLAQVTPPAGGTWIYTYNGDLGTSAGSFALRQMTNPFGGTIIYSYNFANFLPGFVGWSPALAVTQKTAGADTWTYAYSPGCPGSSDDTTTVTLPDGIGQIVYKHFGYCTVTSGDVWKIGLLHQKTMGAIQTETYTWTPQVVSAEIPTRPAYGKNDPQVNRALLSQRTIARDGASYVTTNSNFDSFGNPQTITESGTRSRTRTATYFNDAGKWIVGLIDDETIGSAGSISRSRGASGQLISETRFGVTTSYGNYADGTVASVTTAKPATTSFGGYTRGVPATESRPEGVTISRTPDSLGNVISRTDGEFTWGYTYDGIGRLTSINYPTGASATVSWGNTTRTLTRGGLTEAATFDGFGNVMSVTRGGVARTFDYDGLGRKLFESRPGSGQGTTIGYDILGRVTSMQTSAGTRIFTYSGGAVLIRDERSNTTRYDFDRYGDPDQGYVTGITPPIAGAGISMTRNEAGVLLSATQAGVTRVYNRDTHMFLASIVEPEVGTTTFGRDGVGNMTSKSVGGKTVTYDYDGLNRLTSVTGTGVSATLGYNRRSKLTSLGNGAATRTYGYDANGNLTLDTLTLDGRVFGVTYTYDSIDGLASITYPMSKGTVTYSPDVLGRPTQALPFLTSVSHYGSGNLQAITFGNGIAQSYGENALQQPTTISAGSIMGLTYSYDAVGNVSTLSNSAVPGESRSFTYDTMDRLLTASGPWGGGSINYDDAGNITRQQFGTYAINYNYGVNRVASITGSVNRTYSYDGAGNVTNNGVSSFTFDALSQVTCANCGAPNQASYQYDGQGRRVTEDVNGRRTYFVQAPNGDLLFEYTPYGLRWTKHAYLHGKRVASESGSDATLTTVTTTATPSTVALGQSVTLRATVAPSAATGTVDFLDNGQLLGSSSVSAGSASLAVSSFSAGTHSVTSRYSGDANFADSTSTAITVTVTKATATVSLASSATTTYVNNPVTWTATVSGAAGPATGTVNFLDGASSIAGCSAISIASGTASCTSSALAVGNHTIVARYSGDASYNTADSATVTQSVLATPTDLAVTQSFTPNPAESGKDVVFTVTVTNNGPVVANGVTITDVLPSGWSYVWSDACSPAGSTVTCASNPLSVNASAIFKIVARPSAGGTAVNTVTVSGSQDDTVPGNNTSSASITVAATSAGVPVLRYRLYNPSTAEHLYTIDANEYAVLATIGWQQEGTQGYILNNPGSYNGVASTPYYRLYYPGNGMHLWTTDANEYYVLIRSFGWGGEGADTHILVAPTTGTLPLYRLYFPDSRGLHHWTTDANEYNVLIASYGWVGEGISGYLIAQ